jgi:hypothetical protein
MNHRVLNVLHCGDSVMAKKVKVTVALQEAQTNVEVAALSKNSVTLTW